MVKHEIYPAPNDFHTLQEITFILAQIYWPIINYGEQLGYRWVEFMVVVEFVAPFLIISKIGK